MNFVEQILQCWMIGLEMAAEYRSADLKGVDSLGKGIGAVAGDQGFAEFAHGHKYGRHFLRRLGGCGEGLGLCWIERWRCG